MRPERTFWEKATAVHVFCQQGEFRGGERFSRHWHDLTRLDRAGIADTAIADRALALAVAKHKSMFFSKKDSAGALITSPPYPTACDWFPETKPLRAFPLITPEC